MKILSTYDAVHDQACKDDVRERGHRVHNDVRYHDEQEPFVVLPYLMEGKEQVMQPYILHFYERSFFIPGSMPHTCHGPAYRAPAAVGNNICTPLNQNTSSSVPVHRQPHQTASQRLLLLDVCF